MLLSQLNYFRVAARQEHISRAAEELHIAQPALSVTIRKIEEELGVPLFERNGRHIELNENGKALLMYVDYIFEQLTEMEIALTKTREILENEFTLAVSNSTFLNGWLQQFILQNPEIHLRQKMLSEEQMIIALMDGSIDVALGEFGDIPPEIIRKDIVEDEYVITIPIEHPLSKKEKIYFEDIRHEDIIALSSNAIVKIADRIFSQKDCKPNIVFEGNQRMMAKMVRSNRGLLFDSRQMVYMNYLRFKEHTTRTKDSYHVVVQTIADLNCRCHLSLCWKKSGALSIAAQKFIQTMERDYPNYTMDKEYREKKAVYLMIG